MSEPKVNPVVLLDVSVWYFLTNKKLDMTRFPENIAATVL